MLSRVNGTSHAGHGCASSRTIYLRGYARAGEGSRGGTEPSRASARFEDSGEGARDDVPGGGVDDSTRGGWRRVGRAPKDEREEAAAGGAASARAALAISVISRFLRGIGPVQTGPAVDVTARRQHHGLARYLARADAARERAAERDRRRFGGPAGHRPRVARRRQFGDPRTVRQVRACLRTIRGGGGKRPRALPAARDARPSSTADPARAKGCASAVGRRARGPGAGVCRRKARATFQIDFDDLARDLPRFQRALFSGQHDLPSPTPGLVVLVCKSSFGDLKNTLNEISPIEHFVFDRLLRVEHFFDRLVVDASPTCLPCYEIQQKLHLAEYGRAESMTHTQVRASRSLLRHSFVALPTGRGGALSPPLPPDVVDVVLRDAARGTFRDAHDFRWRALSRVPARGADRGSRSRREMSRRRLARRGARSRPCVRGRLFALDLRRPRPGSGDGGAPSAVRDRPGRVGAVERGVPLRPAPPTAVLIHGILGSRRNLLSFANRLARAFPSWQFVLVDLRCHGQTASMPDPRPGRTAS